MIPFFGASVYDDPAVYAKSSPINFIKKVKTPTLILVGDSDGEVPAPQSFEYWHALKTLGVPTELVVYPHEGHRISQPEHIEDIITRMVGWFDTHMPETGTASSARGQRLWTSPETLAGMSLSGTEPTSASEPTSHESKCRWPSPRWRSRERPRGQAIPRPNRA